MNIKICINNIEGGVATLMFNLSSILDCKLHSHFILIQTYEKRQTYDPARINKSVNIFNFNYYKNGNFYKAFKECSTYLSDADIVIANDWFELGAVSNFPIDTHIIFMVHGDYDYYYNLATLHQNIISTYVCVSKKIQLQLQTILPNRYNDIVYIPPLVPKLKSQLISTTSSSNLKIVFIGRLVEGKGFYLLPKIDEILKNRNVYCEFYIAGSGVESLNDVQKSWVAQPNVHYLGEMNNLELRRELHKYDIYLLPSYAEGFPVSLIESMQAGLVPIVTNLESGIPEIVEHNKNGYIVEIDDVEAIVLSIQELHKDRVLLDKMKSNSFKSALSNFESSSILDGYFTIIDKLNNRKKHSLPSPKKVYRSRLDSPYFPDAVVCIIRKIYK